MSSQQRNTLVGLAFVSPWLIGFVLLVAFNRELLAVLLLPGLSLGILLGALVIVTAWVLTWVYVSWANRHHDGAVDAIRDAR